MKNTKNRVLSLVSIVVLISAQSSNGAQQMAEKSAKLSAQLSTQNPGFELYNKSHETTPTTISYTISAGDTVQANSTTKSGSVGAGKADKQVIPASLFAKLTITANGKTSNFDIKPGRKTIYLSWKPGNKPELYPQTGKKMGLSGETDSGLPIGFMGATNVKQSEITPK